MGEIKNKITPITGKNTFQSIFGYVDIVLSGAEGTFRSRIEKILEDLVDVNIKTTIYNSAPTKVIEASLIAPLQRMLLLDMMQRLLIIKN